MESGFASCDRATARPPAPRPEWINTGHRYGLLNCDIWYSAEAEKLPVFSLDASSKMAVCRYAVKWGDDPALKGLEECFLTEAEKTRFAAAAERIRKARQAPDSSDSPATAKRSVQPSIYDSFNRMAPTPPVRAKRHKAATDTASRSARRRTPSRRSPAVSDDSDGLSGI